MGRLLETLKQGSRPLADQCVVDWTLRDPEEVPYIEVGDGKKIEGSSQVMAVKHPPQAPVQPPHPPTEKILTPVHKTIALTEPKPMSVAYEPWPGTLVPARGVASEVIAFHQPNHPISQQYAGLFDKMLEGQTPGTKALLLTGSKTRVGTTTALLNLAVVGSAQGKRRLVLVDAHLARPSLAQRLGLSAGLGLQEILAGNAALETAVLKTPVAGLHLVAARAEANAAVGHLTTEALAWLLGWLKSRFDLVLVDGPGAEEASDLALLAPLADGVYLVVPQGEMDAEHKTLAQNILRQGGRLKGVIHTHFEM